MKITTPAEADLEVRKQIESNFRYSTHQPDKVAFVPKSEGGKSSGWQEVHVLDKGQVWHKMHTENYWCWWCFLAERFVDGRHNGFKPFDPEYFDYEKMK